MASEYTLPVMIVLGLGGKPHSGKTLAAEAIAQNFVGVKVYSFSALICEEMGVKREETDARFVQDWGTMRRKESEFYWCDRLFPRMIEECPAFAVIPNVRMFPEIAWIRKLGGHLIRYTRLDLDGTPWITNDRDMNHELETALDDFNWDHYITVKHGEKRLLELQTLALVSFIVEKRAAL